MILLLCLAAMGLAAAQNDSPVEPEEGVGRKLASLLPLGRPVKGIRIPTYREDGSRNAVLMAAQATRVDDEFMDVESLRLDAYPRGDGDASVLKLRAPRAAFRFSGSILSSRYATTVTREGSFEARAESMVYAHDRGIGCLLGDVRSRVFIPGEKDEKSKAARARKGKGSPLGKGSTTPLASPPEDSANGFYPAVIPPLPGQDELLKQATAAIAEAEMNRLRTANLLVPSHEDEARRERALTPLKKEQARGGLVPGSSHRALPDTTAPGGPGFPGILIILTGQKAPPVESGEDSGDDLLGPPPKKARTSSVLEGGYIINISAGSAFIDKDKRIIVYQDDVVLDHPDFVMICDKLEVFIGKDESGVDEAIASGDMVVITRKNPDVKPEVARCRRAVYKNEIIILSGRPQIQRGNRLTKAAAARTRLIIPRKGKVSFEGPVNTQLIEKRKDNPN